MISLLSGFLVIFTGVYLLNLSQHDPNGQKLLRGKAEDGIPTDGIAGLQTRLSMQAGRSLEAHRFSSGSASVSGHDDREGLIHSYDEENGGFRLTELTEESDEEGEIPRKSTDGRTGHVPLYTKKENI